MSVYTWRQKINYRLKAKSRHGVHSPFVYDFTERVLLKARVQGFPVLTPLYKELNQKQQSLVQAIAGHYRISELVWDNRRFTLGESSGGVLYLAADPGGLPGRYAENDIAVILDIYQSAERTKAWLDLSEHQSVPLSIDVFEMGVLFFRKDFKVKQHFILKYR